VHHTNTLTLPLKFDITRAFDLVRWEYQLHVPRRRGFLSSSSTWVATLHVTSSSGNLLHGVPCRRPILHVRGMKEGHEGGSLQLNPLQQLVAMTTFYYNLVTYEGAELALLFHTAGVGIFMAPSKHIRRRQPNTHLSGVW
jgi:hypothetical protein